MPWFNGSTSWEQYLQVFDAIVLSNGWGDATAALQLLSHLQDDALSVALLIPMPLQASRKELTDALSSHYGSPGRLANYRREFDKTVRKMGEDPSNFAIKLETLAVKAFGNMGQIARLRLIRDRFIAVMRIVIYEVTWIVCHPIRPLRDIVDRCRVWESHGTSEMRRTSKPIPEPVYPTYVVEQPDYESEPVCMVSVNKQNSQVDQTDELLRKLLEAITHVTPPPIRVPKANPLDKLTELLMSQMMKSEPAPPPPVEPTGVELLLQNYFARQQSTGLGPRARQMRRNWADVQCFSCGKPGHSATRCPTLDVTFPFILPGMEGREDTNRLSDDIAQNGDRPPSGGKRKLIRREGFASRISYKDRPHDPGGGVGIARGPTSQDDMTRNLPKDTNMNRYNKPAQTPVGGAEMAKPAFNRQTQREMTTAAEVGRKLSDLTEPSLYQGSAVEAEGAVTGATLSTPHRCCDCGIRITAGRNSVTDGDECRELRPSITCQVVPKTAPLTGTGRRQYRLKSQAFVESTDIQNARMLLEVPVLRMPNVFLELAEEARKSVMVDDQLR